MTTKDGPVDGEGAARRAEQHDLDRVVEILVGAFYDDPTWAWAFPDPALRREQQRRLWQLFVEGAARYPNTFLNADRTATAVWIPPGGTELSGEQEARLEALLGDLLGTESGRVLDTFAAFEKVHPHDRDHYYLTLLGTDPLHRGKGAGLRLLQESLQQADDDGAPAYLEASNPVNVALYARYGFATLSTFRLPHGGPELTTMWREPRPAPTLAG